MRSAQRLPELPDARRQRFIDGYGLPVYDAGQLTQSRALADYFEATVKAGAQPKTANSWITGALASKLNEIGAEIDGIADRTGAAGDAGGGWSIRDRSAGRRRSRCSRPCGPSRRTAAEIIAAEGLTQVDDESQIAAMIAGVLSANPDAVAQYRGGKASTFGFLVGQVMKAAKGKANPKRVNEMLKRLLDT